MPIPKSVTKIDKDGIKFVSSVDRVNYTIKELSRAAMIDVAKFLRKEILSKLMGIKGIRGVIKSKRLYRSTQYWVRKVEADLLIGFKHNTWYGAKQELGDSNQPQRNILRNAVYENIPTIILIESQYLSALEDEAKALSLINESEAISSDDEN